MELNVNAVVDALRAKLSNLEWENVLLQVQVAELTEQLEKEKSEDIEAPE